jgi:hypothetical protein
MSNMQTLQDSPKTPERPQPAEDKQVCHHVNKHRRTDQGSPKTPERLHQSKRKQVRHRPNQHDRTKFRATLQKELDSLLARISCLDVQICEERETLEELCAEEKSQNQHIIGLQREFCGLFYNIFFGTELILHTGAYNGAGRMNKIFHQVCESDVTNEIVDLDGKHTIDNDETD